MSDTDIEQKRSDQVDSTDSEATEIDRQVSLMEVARLVHEQGAQIAPNIYGKYKKKFDKANPKHQTGIKIEDDQNQIICRQDWNYQTGMLDDKRQMLVFIGPETDDHEVLIHYPRIRFFFKNKEKNKLEWEYDHAQVGLIERELSTEQIISSSEENSTKTEILETKVDMDDMKRVLGPFMKSDFLQVAPPQN